MNQGRTHGTLSARLLTLLLSLLGFTSGIFLALAYSFGLPLLKRLTNAPGLLAYILCVLFWGGLLCVLYRVFFTGDTHNLDAFLLTPLKGQAATVLTTAAFGMIAALWVNMYGNLHKISGGATSYFWQLMEPWALFVCIAFLLLLFAVMAWRFGWLARVDNRTSFWNKVYWICAAVCIVWTALAMYMPNAAHEAASTYHHDAYFNSVYNAYYGAPYSVFNYNTYGHYAILCSLPLKLIGLQNYTLLMAVLCAACVGMALYCVYVLVQNTCLRFLALLCSGYWCAVLSCGGYQMLPHRVLFPFIILTLIARWESSNKPAKRLWLRLALLFVLCALSFQWNLETGLACALTVAIYLALKLFERESLTSPRLYVRFGACVAGLGASFFAGWGLTSLWNLLHGGAALSLKQFLIPYIPVDSGFDVLAVTSNTSPVVGQANTSAYPYDFLKLVSFDIEGNNNAWLHLILLFCFVLGFVLLKTKAFGGKGISGTELIAASVAAMALGRFVYFMNRVNYSAIFIVFFEAIILAATLASWLLRWVRTMQPRSVIQALAKAGVAAICSLLVLFSFASLYQIQHFKGNPVRTIRTEQAQLTQLTTWMRENVPEGTWGAGSGVAYLYAQLGWENPVLYANQSAVFTRNDAPIRAFQVALEQKEQAFFVETTSVYDFHLYHNIITENYDIAASYTTGDNTGINAGQYDGYYTYVYLTPKA